MGEHSKLLPAGRVVYCESCAEDYIIPEGQPSVYSVDDLKQIQVISGQDIPWADGDQDFIDVAKLSARETKVFWLCPNPDHGYESYGSYCGSTDRSDFAFEPTWMCTDCEGLHESEKDAEGCCSYTREYAAQRAQRDQMEHSPTVSPAASVLKGMSPDQLRAAIREALGADEVEITVRRNASRASIDGLVFNRPARQVDEATEWRTQL
jgi:hypothetical protein